MYNSFPFFFIEYINYMSVSKAYVFDFDDCLIKSSAKIYVYRNNKLIKSLTPQEYNTYIKKSDEVLDFSDFKNPEILRTAKKYKMWYYLQKINNAIKKGANYTIFILTARNNAFKGHIYNYFISNNINEIDYDNILAIGNSNMPINVAKRKELQKISDMYDKVYFFDDDKKNIKLAKTVKGVDANLVEDMGGVVSPMATLLNVPGMGNAVPPGINSFGSGDKWGNTIGMYTQSLFKKKKNKKNKKKKSKKHKIKTLESFLSEYNKKTDEIYQDDVYNNLSYKIFESKNEKTIDPKRLRREDIVLSEIELVKWKDLTNNQKEQVLFIIREDNPYSYINYKYITKNKQKRMQVILYKGVVLGFFIPLFNSTNDTWSILSFQIGDKYKKLGIGKQVIIDFFKDKPGEIFIKDDNIESINTFISVGFKPIRKYEDGHFYKK